MNYRALFILPILATLFLSCQTMQKKKEPITLDRDPEPLKLGQWFQYQHTGPRPWGDANQDVSGIRMVSVVDKRDNLAVVEEEFKGEQDIQYGWYDERFHLHEQLLRGPGGELSILYKPPLPARHLKIKAGEEARYESKLSIRNPADGTELGQTVIKQVTKRLRDERLVTSAGALLCRHFSSEINLQMTFLGETTTYGATEETWWYDGAGWFVREKLTFQPIIQNGEFIRAGYTTESTIVDYEQNP